MTDTVPPAAVAAELDHADSLGLLHRQTGILELIGNGAPLPEVLTAVATALEELILYRKIGIDAEAITVMRGHPSLRWFEWFWEDVPASRALPVLARVLRGDVPPSVFTPTPREAVLAALDA